MRREFPWVLVACAVLLAGCSRLERLSFIRPTAARGDYTQVAQTYEVSDKGRKSAPVTAVQLLSAATSAYNDGKLDQAESSARQALKADPKSGDAHTLLAAIAADRGNAAQAGEHFQQAVTLSPAVGAYANNYGTWLCGNGREAESLAWFDTAVDDPNYATRAAAFANAGTCANKAGLQSRAEIYWRTALGMDPQEVRALAGMAGLQLARSDYLAARAFAERWLAVIPADPDGLRLAAQIEEKLGDTAAAQRYLSRLQATSPDTSTAPRTQ